MNGTVSAAGKCNIVIEVKVTSEGQGVNFVGLNVTVDFTGDRLAADKSSEALIKEFIFNSDSISDVIIADKTIEFYAPVSYTHLYPNRLDKQRIVLKVRGRNFQDNFLYEESFFYL